jgi:hypothetical protein
MSEEEITFNIHIVGVSGPSSKPFPVTAPIDATLQDVLDTLIESNKISQASDGQEWKFKIDNEFRDASKTLRQVGIKNTEPPMGLKLVLEQSWAIKNWMNAL